MGTRERDRIIHPVIAGTAGHIDHGKSSLVKAITGVDPDRLKEEKERGMTIDLGFAPLALRDGRWMGLIDVPGHERLVRNMVAGCTSMDLAILVVAADDGMMPQTLEHLDILDLLEVKRGLVALTKVDLVDEETAELAEQEVVETLAATTLAGSEVVRVSAVTGQGIAEFRQKLEALAGKTPPRAREGPFRMPIQRVFKLKGIGTVVTGVPVSGTLQVGDEVEFVPLDARSRVRAIQAYGGEVPRAMAGHSTALSVPDARVAGLRRGVVAAQPGVFQAGDAVDVDVRVLARSPVLVHRARVRFHTGTNEVRGSLLLTDEDRLQPGQRLVARVLLDEALCCAPGDHFLLRLENPVRTVGGGIVLRLSVHAGRYRRRALGEELHRIAAAGSSLENRVRAQLEQVGPAGATPAELATTLGVEVAEVDAVVRELPDVHVHERAGRAFLRDVLEAGTAELLTGVDKMLRDKPLAASVPRASLRQSRTLPLALQNAVLDELTRAGRVRTTAHGAVMFLDRLAPLPPRERELLDRLVAICDERGFRPPEVGELNVGVSAGELQGLLARALDEGRIVQIGEHYYGQTVVRRAMVEIRRNCLRHDGELNIPELRDALDTSRKYLIPLLEHIDGTGLTRLRGGVRILLTSSAISQELAASDAR